METWKLNKLHLFPIFFVLWIVAGMLICFSIAFLNQHVSVYVPFISETGGKLPESGIFTFFLCIGFLLGFICMIIRYFIIFKWNSQRSKIINFLNKISYLVGLFSLCGMVIVGCYSMYGLMDVHMAGAYLLFYTAVLYGFLHMVISLLMQPRFCRFGLFQARIIICIFSIAFLIGMILTIRKGSAQWKATYPFAKKVPGDQGFLLLLTSSICEWMMVICFLCFFLSFAIDFRKFAINISIFENEYRERNLEISGPSSSL